AARRRAQLARPRRPLMRTASAEGRALLFLHVRKTGGTSLGGALGNRFAAAECLPLYDREPPSTGEVRAHRFVSGHLAGSFVSHFERPPVVVACLRDPLERTLSAYSYYRWFPERDYEVLRPQLGEAAYGRRVAAMRLARERSLAELIAEAPELAREHFGNVQCAALAGADAATAGEETLEAALADLERCDVVTLTERLEESAGLLTRRLGWSSLGPLPRAKELDGRLRRDQLDASTVAALERLTELDRELHAQAIRRFERDLASGASGDLGAGLPDAPLLPDVSFDGPVRGGAWYGRERVAGGPWFAWIGQAGFAWVELAIPAGARTLAVEIPHVIEQPVLEALVVKVAEQVVPYELRPSGSGLLLTAPLPGGLTGDGVRVTLETPRLARPCDVAQSEDRRRLSLAVSRMALRS
ncbi:MAG TPA: hypothetical protein VFN15_02185, partial [Solirubrobacterales bacterium]|nr:hypothetical protein [Solirubrobacterales bacterium]